MTVVTPGQRLGTSTEFAAGDGAYQRQKHIYACRVGVRTVEPVVAGQLPVVSVQQTAAAYAIPRVGDTVLGQVTKVTPRVMHMTIMCVGSTALHESFQGVVRAESVSVLTADKVEMYNCYRPGDVVRAEVLALGDNRSYTLSTAKTAMGVVLARSRAGETMVPLSHEEMQCPVTNTIAKRKVAKTT